MLKCEIILIDPSPGEIAERLADAAADANRRCRTRLVADDPAKWRKFARQTQATPEGFDLWRGGKGGVPATQLVGAWWTDHIGRKHVVIRGRRVEHDGAKPLLDKFELSRRPPLWHCYSERLFQRWLPRENDLPQVEWIAVCGCGATGTPEALGWMGATCGPCHDRREEGTAPHVRPGWVHGERSQFLAVAFGRTGKHLAGIETDGTASVWDFASGTAVRFAPPNRRSVFNADLAFAGAADERLVVNAIGGDAGAGFLHVRDWLGPEQPAVALRDDNFGLDRVWPSRSSGHFVLSRSLELSLLGTDGGTAAVRRVENFDVALPPATDPAPSFVPFVGPDGIRLCDSSTLEPRLTIPYRNRGDDVYHRIRLVVRGDLETIYVGRFNQLDVYDVRSGRYVRTFAVDRIPVAAHLNAPAWIRSMALALDGRVLALAAEERLVVLDAESLAPLAAFAWHVGTIRCLAVSADGRTIATAGNDGIVKLWPMDRLLEMQDDV